MPKKFTNKKRDKLIAETEINIIEESDIGCKSKFNFSFLDETQSAGQSLSDWSVGGDSSSSLLTLNTKLKEFSKEPLSYWKNQRVGGGGLKVLAHYTEGFPRKSAFTEPKNIPVDVEWHRFRFTGKVRLIGFLIPAKLDGVCIAHKKHSFRLDSNTFYIVFLDKKHLFYPKNK